MLELLLQFLCCLICLLLCPCVGRQLLGELSGRFGIQDNRGPRFARPSLLGLIDSGQSVTGRARGGSRPAVRLASVPVRRHSFACDRYEDQILAHRNAANWRRSESAALSLDR